MPVRERTEADLDDCVRLARVVYELDRYPVFLPDDLRRFITAPDALAAWVAELDGQIIGHVALRSNSSAAVVAMASEALKLPADRLGVVARLLVSPQHRRRGTGRSLLEVASKQAHARGLWPILDVVTHQKARSPCTTSAAGLEPARSRLGTEMTLCSMSSSTSGHDHRLTDLARPAVLKSGPGAGSR